MLDRDARVGGENWESFDGGGSDEMVTADGEIVVLSHEKMADHFAGAVVGLGALGVVTKITLMWEPTFQVRQVVYENLSMDQLEKHMQEIFASAYSVSLFTDWQNHRITQVWLKHKVTPGEKFEFAPELYGAKLATQKLHPLADHSAENCTEQLGIPGSWYERLPHFRMNFTPSSGAELQSDTSFRWSGDMRRYWRWSNCGTG